MDWRPRPDVRQILARRDIKALYEVLQAEGISHRAIAERTGQQQSEISEIIKGRRVISYDTLVRIANGLDIPRGLVGLGYDSTPTRRVLPTPPPSQAWAGKWPVRWTPREVTAFRHAARLNVRELAKLLGVSDRMVSKWIAGAIPRQVNQAALDTALSWASAEARSRFAELTGRRYEERSSTGWIAMVPIAVERLGDALDVVDLIAKSSAGIDQMITADIEVFTATRPAERFWAYCGLVMPGTGEQCRERIGHPGTCRPPENQ